MLAEAMGYHRQWKELKRKHKREKDLLKDEFLSGISRNDRFYPIIPLVVYYGTEHEWDACNSLYEFLGESLPDELKKHVNNYKITLFDYHDCDNFEQFDTEIGTLFEFLKSSKDKNELMNIIKKNQQRYTHVDSETGNLIRVLTNNRALDNYCEEPERGEWNMCKAFEDYRLEGKLEGKLEERVAFIRKKYNKGMDAEDISDLLEIDINEVERIISLFCEYPDEDDLFIVRNC